jgi:hypothetical protein
MCHVAEGKCVLVVPKPQNSNTAKPHMIPLQQTQLESLNVAYLDGTYQARAFTAYRPSQQQQQQQQHVFPPPPPDKEAAVLPQGSEQVDGSGSTSGTVPAAAAAATEGDADAPAAAAGVADSEAAAAAIAVNGAASAPKMETSEQQQQQADAETAADVVTAAPPQQQMTVTAPSMRYYHQSDVAKLRQAIMVLPGEVDLLLSCEWPSGLSDGLAAGQGPPDGAALLKREDEPTGDNENNTIDLFKQHSRGWGKQRLLWDTPCVNDR